MPRPESVRVVLALVGVTNLAVACPRPDSPSREEVQEEVALLFDPTVGPNGRLDLDPRYPRAVRFSFLRITPLEARLWIGVVSPGGANHPVRIRHFR